MLTYGVRTTGVNSLNPQLQKMFRMLAGKSSCFPIKSELRLLSNPNDNKTHSVRTALLRSPWIDKAAATRKHEGNRFLNHRILLLVYFDDCQGEISFRLGFAPLPAAQESTRTLKRFIRDHMFTKEEYQNCLKYRFSRPARPSIQGSTKGLNRERANVYPKYSPAENEAPTAARR